MLNACLFTTCCRDNKPHTQQRRKLMCGRVYREADEDKVGSINGNGHGEFLYMQRDYKMRSYSFNSVSAHFLREQMILFIFLFIQLCFSALPERADDSFYFLSHTAYH